MGNLIYPYITKFPIGSKDKHPEFLKLLNYTMSTVGNSSNLSVESFSATLGDITSTGVVTNSNLTFINITYVSANSSTCSAPLSDSLDSQGSVIVVSAVSSI